jgi:hypothetical protein
MGDKPIPVHVQEELSVLKRWANRLAGHYGAHVYLVGSALEGDNPKPRDWDIRINMSDEDFAVRFGDVDTWTTEGGTGEWTDVRWRWSRECTKTTKDGWHSCGLNIDFQIYPLSHVERVYPFERLQLDTMP